MPLKLEVNTREHFAVHGFTGREYTVSNPWFSGTAEVTTYTLTELLSTKLLALYQRKKGRDLYDLWLALSDAAIDRGRVIECFSRYLKTVGSTVSRAQFEANLAGKMQDVAFVDDVRILIPQGVPYDPHIAAEKVLAELIARLPGESWKGSGRSR